MVTRYRDLIALARTNLATATARQAHPATGHSPGLPPYLADLAGALAHLGATVGDTGRPARQLRTALTGMATLDLGLADPDPTQVTGIAEDLAEATIYVRVAADLITSHGPHPGDVTDRHLGHDWAHPRPDHLAARPARQGAWTQIADLATLTAALADTPREHPLITAAGTQVADAAAAVPRHDPDPRLDTTGPAWPLPLPRRPVPDEWAGRLEELTALAWRMTLPPGTGRAHPIAGLRLIAETGYQLHTQAAHRCPHPDLATALSGRADLWQNIHRHLHTIRTPTEPLMPAQQFALMRTRALAVAPLDAADLLAGRTALAQAAAWAISALEHHIGNPVVGLGPDLTPELRTQLRDFHPPRHGQHPYETALLATHNRRPASPIPPGALDPLAALYRAAAAPVDPAPGPRRTTRPATVLTAVMPARAASPGPRPPGAHR